MTEAELRCETCGAEMKFGGIGITDAGKASMVKGLVESAVVVEHHVDDEGFVHHVARHPSDPKWTGPHDPNYSG